MKQATKEDVEQLVQKAIERLQQNPLGLRIAPDGVQNVDGRWWAIIDVTEEGVERTKIWDALAELEGIVESLEPPEVNVALTAA